jgi:hypothetical protein
MKLDFRCWSYQSSAGPPASRKQMKRSGLKAEAAQTSLGFRAITVTVRPVQRHHDASNTSNFVL